MKKDNKTQELRTEYKRSDLGKGTRGKYLEAYHQSNNLVLLKPEVAKVFHDEESVNNALISLIQVAQSSVHTPTP